MQDSVTTCNKRRANVLWALGTILLISVSELVGDFCGYHASSLGLELIRLPPHLYQRQEEENISYFKDIQDTIRWRMAQHSVLIFLSLACLWNVSRNNFNKPPQEEQALRRIP